VNVPNLVQVGGATTTTKLGTASTDKVAARIDALADRVTIGTGVTLVVVEAISAWATASKANGSHTVLNGGSTVVSVRVGDQAVTVPTGVNQKVDVAGFATLTFNKIEKRGSIIAVTAFEVYVKALNSKVRIAYAEAGVVA
jgi:hypothetical protein